MIWGRNGRMAVVAKHRHPHVPVFVWHRAPRDSRVHLGPGAGRRCNRYGAEGAAGKRRLAHQRPQAVAMHGVATSQHTALRGGVEEVLLAHGAVLMHAALDTAVIVAQLDGVAASGLQFANIILCANDTAWKTNLAHGMRRLAEFKPACEAVEKVLSPAHSAYAAAVAMKWPLREVIVYMCLCVCLCVCLSTDRKMKQ